MGKFVDLTNKQFGKLTVIKRVEDYITPKGQKSPQWLCKCNCEYGNEIIVAGGKLTKKNGTKSCGCLQKEKASEIGKKNKKYNTYDLSGEYGIGYTSKGEEFWFDLEDYDLIKYYCWHIDANGYVVTCKTDDKQYVYMHRFILGIFDDDLEVDHIHHNKNDNRKSKLRVCNHRQNCMNMKTQENNTTGVSGVTYRKENCKKKYRVTIGIEGEQVKIGSYENFDEAVDARIKAENEYYGEYSFRNSQMECKDNEQ